MAGNGGATMPVMGTFSLFRGRTRLLVPLILILILMLGVGCSRPTSFPAEDSSNQADQGKLPFQDNATKGPGNEQSIAGAGSSGAATEDQASKRDPRAASGPPFQSLSSVPELPSGTLVTVRLEKQISSDRINNESTFAAVVDEPVVMDGKMVVPRGATVTGTVESARASDMGGGRGYIRLTLDTIVIAGKKLPLKTSNLFVRGRAGEVLSPGQDDAEPASPTITALQKGRRLTFRLAATVPLYRPETASSSQSHLTGTE
jgi:hypothetical protein